MEGTEGLLWLVAWQALVIAKPAQNAATAVEQWSIAGLQAEACCACVDTPRTSTMPLRQVARNCTCRDALRVTQ